MKITYDMQEDEQREVMAFIDEDGDLYIKGDTGESIIITTNCAYESCDSLTDWMEGCEVVKTFYRGSGDSVTITF